MDLWDMLGISREAGLGFIGLAVGLALVAGVRLLTHGSRGHDRVTIDLSDRR